MINFHLLDNTTLDTNGQSEYTRFRYDFISLKEGVVPTVYLDTVGIPSNGIGFNLMDDNILELVLKAFGMDALKGSTLFTKFHDIVAVSYANGTNPQTALDVEMANQHSANTSIRSTFAFADGVAGKAEMRAVFDRAVLIYDNSDTTKGVSIALLLEQPCRVAHALN